MEFDSDTDFCWRYDLHIAGTEGPGSEFGAEFTSVLGAVSEGPNNLLVKS